MYTKQLFTILYISMLIKKPPGTLLLLAAVCLYKALSIKYYSPYAISKLLYF